MSKKKTKTKQNKKQPEHFVKKYHGSLIRTCNWIGPEQSLCGSKNDSLKL